MTRKQETSTTVNTNGHKPALQWAVMVNGSPLFTALKPNDAVKQATPLLRAGAQGIEIHQHNGEGWVKNEQFTQKAVDSAKGIGNPEIARLWSQVSQMATALSRQNTQKNGVESNLVAETLDMFFAVCSAQGVTQEAIDSARSKHYSPAQEYQPSSF